VRFWGIAVWPQRSHLNHLPPPPTVITLKWLPCTQYGHRMTSSGMLNFRSSVLGGISVPQSGNSIQSACFLSRSCSSARTFSSQCAWRSATALSTNAGE
jgi:hypothetical protein